MSEYRLATPRTFGKTTKRWRKDQRGARGGPNRAEKKFREFAEEQLGCHATKRGWPDFVCEDEDGIFFVEVKPSPNSRLKKDQQRVMIALMNAGFRCYVWNPVTGLVKMKFNPVQPSP